jgi:hypothetical protein
MSMSDFRVRFAGWKIPAHIDRRGDWDEAKATVANWERAGSWDAKPIAPPPPAPLGPEL